VGKLSRGTQRVEGGPTDAKSRRGLPDVEERSGSSAQGPETGPRLALDDRISKRHDEERSQRRRRTSPSTRPLRPPSAHASSRLLDRGLSLQNAGNERLSALCRPALKLLLESRLPSLHHLSAAIFTASKRWHQLSGGSLRSRRTTCRKASAGAASDKQCHPLGPLGPNWRQPLYRRVGAWRSDALLGGADVRSPKLTPCIASKW
jgi:hypothetical protein